jgi:hypothetical protein
MSKFGAHVSSGARQGFGEALALCAAAGSPVPVLFAFAQNLWDDVQKFSPSTVLIYRTKIRINGADYDNPPNMYQADAVAVANDWYARAKPLWLLNKAHYYAPTNERNPNKNDAAQNAWWAAFDLRLMLLADDDYIKLALHGDSMGTPDYADWQYYHASLAYAAQHGHIITRHEPVEGVDLAFRYRKEHAIIEAFAPGLQMAISECYGIGMGHPEPYVDSFQAYDLEAMKDDYLLGFAAYQIGGDETFTPAIPRWASWVATHPTPDNGEPVPMSKGGLHLSAQGNNINDPSLPLEIQAMKTAGLVRAKFMTNGNPEFVHQLVAAGFDMAGSVCRLYAAGDNTALGDPTRFYLEQRAYITEVYGHGVRMFEIHNEPNLTSEGMGRFWSSPAEFAANFYAPVAQLILSNFPDAKIVYPGLAPRDDWATWKPSIASLIAQGLVQLIGVHCYWDSAVNMRRAEQGRTFERFADMGRDLIITEASHNIPNVTDTQKGTEYAEYISTLPSYVNGVYFFVSYGPGYDASGETWVRGNPPVMTAIPAAVAAGAIEPPVVEYEFDGNYTFAGVLINRLPDYAGTLTVNTDIETRYKVVTPPPVQSVVFQHRVVPASLASRVTVTPAPGTVASGTAFRIVAT